MRMRYLRDTGVEKTRNVNVRGSITRRTLYPKRLIGSVEVIFHVSHPRYFCCFFYFTLNFYEIGFVLPTDREIESDSRCNYERVCPTRRVNWERVLLSFLQYAKARREKRAAGVVALGPEP